MYAGGGIRKPMAEKKQRAHSDAYSAFDNGHTYSIVENHDTYGNYNMCVRRRRY